MWGRLSAAADANVHLLALSVHMEPTKLLILGSLILTVANDRQVIDAKGAV